MTIDEINAQIDILKEQREEVQRQAKIITKQINSLKRRIWHKESYVPRPKHTDTIVYKTFGKQYKDMTTDEKRKYNAMRKKEERNRKKSM